MRSILWRLLVFLCTALGLYMLIVVLLSRIKFNGDPLILYTADYYQRPGGNTWFRFREFDRTERYDAIIVGSSHVNQGYAPHVFADKGYHAFLLGNGSQGPLNSYQILNEYVNHENCRLVIIDVYNRVFIQDGFESTVDLITNLPDQAPAFKLAVAQADIRAWNVWSLRQLYPKTHPELPADYIGLGFNSRPDSIKKPSAPPRHREGTIPRNQILYTKACIEYCQHRNIPVILSNHFQRRQDSSNVSNDVDALVNKLSKEYGVPYLNFSNVPGIEEENWFSDYVHLNRTGAQIFTERLVDSLATLGYLHNPSLSRKASNRPINGSANQFGKVHLDHIDGTNHHLISHADGESN